MAVEMKKKKKKKIYISFPLYSWLKARFLEN